MGDQEWHAWTQIGFQQPTVRALAWETPCSLPKRKWLEGMLAAGLLALTEEPSLRPLSAHHPLPTPVAGPRQI